MFLCQNRGLNWAGVFRVGLEACASTAWLKLLCRCKQRSLGVICVLVSAVGHKMQNVCSRKRSLRGFICPFRALFAEIRTVGSLHFHAGLPEKAPVLVQHYWNQFSSAGPLEFPAIWLFKRALATVESAVYLVNRLDALFLQEFRWSVLLLTGISSSRMKWLLFNRHPKFSMDGLKMHLVHQRPAIYMGREYNSTLHNFL